MTAKLRANLDALAVLNDCRGEARWATADEQTVLARWSGWGSVPAVFDPDDDRHADERTQLRRLLGTEEAWSQARRTTLNAHYTSADVAQAMWGAVSALGVDGESPWPSFLRPTLISGTQTKEKCTLAHTRSRFALRMVVGLQVSQTFAYDFGLPQVFFSYCPSRCASATVEKPQNETQFVVWRNKKKGRTDGVFSST